MLGHAEQWKKSLSQTVGIHRILRNGANQAHHVFHLAQSSPFTYSFAIQMSTSHTHKLPHTPKAPDFWQSTIYQRGPLQSPVSIKAIGFLLTIAQNPYLNTPNCTIIALTGIKHTLTLAFPFKWIKLNAVPSLSLSLTPTKRAKYVSFLSNLLPWNQRIMFTKE